MALVDIVGLLTTPVAGRGSASREDQVRYEQGLDSGQVFQPEPSVFAPSATTYQDAAENLYSQHYVAYACVAAYADAIASLPLKVYERMPDNERKLITSGPLVDLLAKPNPAYDWYEFCYGMVTSFLMGGEAAVEKINSQLGTRVVQMQLMRPDRFGPIVNEREGLVGYQYVVGTQAYGYETNEIIFFKTFNPTNQWRGLSPLTAARLDIETDLFAARHNKSVLQNAGIPGGVLETDQALLKRDRKEMRVEWEALHRGVNKHGRVAILDQGTKFNGATLSQKDLQWLEGRQHSAEAICVVFRMPGTVIGIERSVNRSTADVVTRGWYKAPVRSLTRRFERKLTLELAQTFNKNYFVEFLMDDVLRPEFEKRAEAGSKAWWIKPNEKRKWENLPPVEGGDELYVPVNMAAGGAPVNEVAPLSKVMRPFGR